MSYEAGLIGSVVANAYDEVLYPGYPILQAHPNRLATLATLFGMEPASIQSCRVLELGCGDGANLIPMAFGLPASHFVGVDAAARPLAKGQVMIKSLGLKNIILHHSSVIDVAPELGQFDYIIAHGLYSWVPAAVQDKLLSICKMNLAPQGVAYVSYNTYPGWHLRRMIREMALFHARDLAEPKQRIDQARALMTFLLEAQPKSDVYRMFLSEQLERLSEYRDESVYHDDLAEINSPLYFFQFIDHTERHRLQYLTEAHLFETQTGIFPTHVSDALEQLGEDVIRREQYLDFLKCRMFRQTLLCHQGVLLDRTPDPRKIFNFYVASSVSPKSARPDVDSLAEEEFLGPKGSAIKTSRPLIKSAMLVLGEIWPQSLPCSELLAKAQCRIYQGLPVDRFNFDQEAASLGEVLLRAYAAGLLELHVCPWRFVTEISERPVVSPLARLQVRDGSIITTLRHTSIKVEDNLGRLLLTFLDGTRDRAILLQDMNAAVESNSVVQLGETRASKKIFPDDLEKKLAELAQLALLVA